MQAPASVIELVKKFDRNIEAYKSGLYNETQVRVEFINPLFEALGWDIYNKKGYSEQYKDVIHEFSLKTREYSNAPDYLFKVGTMKKFFVEAKKPVIHIKEDIHPAYQLRRYAWSAKLPLSILTDFEEFAVYDCRFKPNQKDKASVARKLYYTFREYADMWGDLYSKFSKEAVLEGEFDKYAEGGTKVKGTEVDDAFLQEIEGWRDSLARNIALRNQHLSGGELNYSVQKIIDRIIFLRICEGRGIEEFKELHNLSGKNDIYKHLITLFKNADKKYNSGLFHFTKEKDVTEDVDNITPNLSIDDKIFKEIIESLYYPKSPYEFSVFGAEILGHVYEQFLGKVIRLTAGHQAKVEEKPEVKKAGGVYYTPVYIVEYIVKNTLGKRLEEIEEKGRGKGRGREIVEEAGRLRVLDPACGSGSFLLGAYQYLLDWHVKIYQLYENEFKERVYRSGKEMDTDLHLTTKEKKRILLNNIYAVDIDAQAVEVSKLSLLLKVLEGETDETLAKQLDIFTERALPDLSKNIKCGNSLIDTDFYDNETLFEQETSVNPFNWQKGFPEVFANGGFDVVIGNPPWVDIKGLDPNLTQYYFDKYRTTTNRINLYSIFLERGLSIISDSSLFGFIIPNSILYQSSYENIRKLILNDYKLSCIVRLPDNVFNRVKAETIILIIGGSKNLTECVIYNRDDIISKVSSDNCRESKSVNSKGWLSNELSVFDLFSNQAEKNLLIKIESENIPLGQLCDFTLGITPYDKYKGHSQKQINDRVFHSVFKKNKTFKPLLEGADVKRFSVVWSGKEYLSYGSWLGAPREQRFFTEPRILVRQIVSGKPLRIYAGYTDLELYNTQSVFNLLIKDENILSIKYLLALLNSNLLNFYHGHKYLDLSKNLFQKILIQNCKKFPIRLIDYSKKNEILLNNEIIKCGDELIKLNQIIVKRTLNSERTEIQAKIDYCEDRINKIVYELYDLTEEEIRIVERG